MLEYVFNSDITPITREQRVHAARETIYTRCDEQQKEFIRFVLQKYIESGVGELALEKLPDLVKIKYQSIADAEQKLGKAENIRLLFSDFQKYLYQQAA